MTNKASFYKKSLNQPRTKMSTRSIPWG